MPSDSLMHISSKDRNTIRFRTALRYARNIEENTNQTRNNAKKIASNVDTVKDIKNNTTNTFNTKHHDSDHPDSSIGGKVDREWKNHKWVARKRNDAGKWIYDYGNGFGAGDKKEIDKLEKESDELRKENKELRKDTKNMKEELNEMDSPTFTLPSILESGKQLLDDGREFISRFK